MSDLSGGQIAGAIVGGIIGAFLGGPVGAFKGAALGLSLGGYIDPPTGPTLRGPTIDDKSFQSTSYGVVLPRVYGRVALFGNVIYLENNEYKAVDSSQTTGGKGGGGGQKVTTTTYYATFAVALSTTYAGSKPYRVWAGGKLILGGELTGYKKVDGKTKKLFDYRFYDGTQTTPDPRMESVLGVDHTPSYEGTAYIIFYDFDLTEYGNSLAGCPIKVEFFVPDPVAEAEQINIQNFSIQNVEDITFPTDMDDFTGCSIAMEQNRQYAIYSWAPSSGDGTNFRYYARYGSIGVINRAEIEGFFISYPPFVHSKNQQANRIRWAFVIEANDVIGQSVLYTNLGIFANPFPSTTPGYAFANVRAVFSIDGVNYALYRVENTPPPFFPYPLNTQFLTVFLSNQAILNLGNLDDFNSINYTILAGKFYLLTRLYDSGSNTTESVFTIYSLLNGSVISSEIINIPIDNDVHPFPKAAEIFDGKFFCGGVISAPGNLFLITVDIVSYACSVKLFPIESVSGYATSNFQLSVYNGVVGMFVSRFDSTLSEWFYKIYTLAAPVIDYENPQSNRIPIIDIVERELNAVGIPASEYNLSQIASDTTVGYKISEVTAARAAIGPIQSAYLFDFVERGYLLTAVKRGTDSIVTIPFKHLILTGDAAVKSSTESRVLMPSKLTLNYIDYTREYDAGSQSADYPAAYESVQSKDLAVVMDADEAAKLADIFIRSMAVEAKDYNFTVPYIYLDLLVGDVITVEVIPGKFVKMRIDQRTLDVSAVIQLVCTVTSELTYVSDASGYTGETGSEIYIPSYADPIPIILDIPLIRIEQDIFGVAATVVQAPPTTQSALFVSANDGITYAEIGRFNGPGAVGQSSMDVLGAGDQFVVERGTDLVIDNLISGDFFSVTYEQMLRNNNLIAYGQPGRWEILSYQDATPTIEGGVILSTFIRGKFGTEQYMDGHYIGDLVVLLDHPNTIFAALPAQAFGLSWPIKAVNVGDDLDGGVLAEYGSYQAVNLKPLSVVDPELTKSGNDWLINFDPRTRYPSNQWVNGAIEQTDTQYYDVDVFNGSAVVRTIQSPTIPVIYTQAQQIADFGSAQTTITIDIYQVNQRVGRGYPLRVTA